MEQQQDANRITERANKTDLIKIAINQATEEEEVKFKDFSLIESNGFFLHRYALCTNTDFRRVEKRGDIPKDTDYLQYIYNIYLQDRGGFVG